MNHLNGSKKINDMTFVKLNGITLHYKFIHQPISLDAKHKTFLFINSLGTDFRIWDDVVSEMKQYGNILLLDNRGHGLSDVTENTAGLEDYMDDVIALLNHLKIQTCIPVGLSVGGMIAQLLAYHFPAFVEKIVLCDTAHKIATEIFWNERINAVRAEGIASISDTVIQRWFSESFHQAFPEKATGYKNMLERTPLQGYIQTCAAIRDTDLSEIARQIKIPALCIVGSEDKSTSPEEVKVLSELIPGSKYKVIDGSGHIPCVDNPEILNKLILDFIKQE